MHRPAVLVVDDEDELRAFVAAFLKDAGFAVRTAADGRYALETLAREPFEAVVLDLQMPRLDGFDVLQTIRANPALVTLGVVILSGDEQRTSIERGLALGADDYLLKPFSAWELEARLRGVIARIRMRRGVAG